MLIDGNWDPDAELTTDDDGRFIRQQTTFRDTIEAQTDAKYPVESGRYHLYVSYACPWAHRTLIGRSMLELEEHISVSVVDPIRHDQGWEFSPDTPGCTRDHLFDSAYLREIYTQADPHYTGRVTVPVLFDRQTESIVNNESAEILRQFTTTVASHVSAPIDLYPTAHAPTIDEHIKEMYEPINNGVYRAGFAKSQAAYDEAIEDLFTALDTFDRHLEQQRYLVGSSVTEADICLFTTLIRFDPVYHIHFKCSKRRIRDYPNLWKYMTELASIDAIAKTINMEHIRGHYYRSHTDLNPSGIIAVEPASYPTATHDRAHPSE